MHVRIAQTGKALFEGEAESLLVPGVEGEMTILPLHEPLITTLKRGILTVRAGGKVLTFNTEKGLVEVSNNEVIVLL